MASLTARFPVSAARHPRKKACSGSIVELIVSKNRAECLPGSRASLGYFLRRWLLVASAFYCRLPDLTLFLWFQVGQLAGL
jgi:hypothetical protein